MFAFQFDGLNRQGEMRQDKNFLNTIVNDKQSVFLPIYKQNLAAENDKLVWLSYSELLALVGSLSEIHIIYLGAINEKHYLAYRLSSYEQLESLSGNVEGLRNLLATVSEQDAYLANVATGLNQWHASHQHCGYCGAETYAKESGFVRQCSNESCQKEHYPRTDPAVICSIIHTNEEGVERILLGRQASWPEKRYSVIAGFVEPGESLEQAVKREAFEEVGIELAKVDYIASQPWPFPQSNMIGFTAAAKTTKIDLKDKELEHADWFTKNELTKMVTNDQIRLPFPYSISRNLIEIWLNPEKSVK